MTPDEVFGAKRSQDKKKKKIVPRVFREKTTQKHSAYMKDSKGGAQ